MVNHNLYSFYECRFQAALSRPVIETDEGKHYTYRDLAEETARYSALLTSLGARNGDRVLAQVDKSPQSFFLYLAAIRAGVVYVPLNPAYRKAELEYILSDAEPKVIVCRPDSAALWTELVQGTRTRTHIETMDENGGGSLAERVRSRPPGFTTVATEPGDTAAIFYTSGTTGRPKGAMITHRNLTSNAESLCEHWRWCATDVLIHAVPLFHVHGLHVATCGTLTRGAKMILLPKFETDAVLRHLAKATILMGVPTFYTRLLEQPAFDRESCANIRLFISGSAPLLEQTLMAVQERTGHAILNRYGLTETGANSCTPVDGPYIPGGAGLPLPGVTIRIADADCREVPAGEVGELQIKGENVLPGYWRKSKESAASFTPDGYFRTGDLGRRDENGFLSVVGRSKDLVITGGLNVYPREVEAAIDQLDGVLESAVIGVPHPDFGEAVIALVVMGKTANRISEQTITAQLKQTMANYKVPKRVFFVTELPRNAMGKVQKSMLRENPEYASAFTNAIWFSTLAPLISRSFPV
ncbi:MAG: AMP-binding protein [Acidobacteria bacterium]|nr:AMP-binding protein [Acidobacteriota bacterium]